jgi:hypothetical protein
MNGRRDDHPLTDIRFYNREVYGEETDSVIREIRGLCSERELYEWWDKVIRWSSARPMVLRQARMRLEELSRRARESGWEVKGVRESGSDPVQ